MARGRRVKREGIRIEQRVAQGGIVATILQNDGGSILSLDLDADRRAADRRANHLADEYGITNSAGTNWAAPVSRDE